MKKINFLIIFMISFLFVLANACNKQTELIENAQEKVENNEHKQQPITVDDANIVGQFVDGETQFRMSKENIFSLVNKHPMYVFKDKKDDFKLEKMYFDVSTARKSYLIVEGYVKEESVVIATELVLEKGGALRMNMEVYPDQHTCSGHKCAKCSFTRNNDGNVDGCTCKRPLGAGAYCNHTVTTSD